MITELRGVNFRPASAKEVVKILDEDASLSLRRDAGNPYDPNAIQVIEDESEEFIGFVAKEDAAQIAPRMDAGESFTVTFESRTGTYGIILSVEPAQAVSENVLNMIAEGDESFDEDEEG